MDTTQILSAVHSRLTGDAPLVALCPTIGNYLSQGAAYPHMLFQLDFETLRIKDEDAQEVTLQLDIWTRYRGSKEALAIADAARTALDGIPVTIASGDGFGCQYETMDSFIEPEGTVYRVTMTFSLLYGDN